VKASWHELSYVIHVRESVPQTRSTVVAVLMGIGNIFLCAFFERYVVGPGWRDALVTLLALECGLLMIVAMGIHLQTIDPVLKRTRIHPLRPSARFAFIVQALLRHRYVVVLWGSAVFSMTLMVHPTPGTLPFVVLAFLVPGIALVIISASLFVLFKRWNASGAVALAALGIVACLTSTATIMFPGSHLLELLMPLRWCSSSCSAALSGDLLLSTAQLLPFAALAALAWAGGAHYA
jgi:hypothetical protein